MQKNIISHVIRQRHIHNGVHLHKSFRIYSRC